MSSKKKPAGAAPLQVAFDAAITQVERSLASGMTTMNGEPAGPQLQELAEELRIQRREAESRGAVDRDWFMRTVRWMDEWVPESEITLIAALGRIARVGAPPVS
jgi:hypothetical protein